MWVRGDGAGIDLGHGEVDRGQYAEAVEIELFTGGAVLLAARFLADVGGFDERYFLYYEDIDLARRGRERGWQYLVEPRAVVHHAMSSTASTLPGLHRYWQERNRLWWLVRHGSPLQVLRGVVLSLARLAKHPIRAQATAIRDGLAGSPWCWRERRGRPVVAPLPVTVRWTVR
jgi:GT2 family glycosyltransferase